MMPSFETGRQVENAITQAARRAAGSVKTDVKRHVDHAYHDRFLCRVFSEPDGLLLLKGGTRMLALIPGGRSTGDVDLEARHNTLEHAVALLRRLAAVDLEDWFTFSYRCQKATIGDNQPRVEGTRVTFDVAVQGRSHGSLSVDLVVHPRPTAPVVVAAPAFRLPIDEFQTFDYAMIAVEDQMADKACAMMSGFGAGTGSSRAKDLVDLVLIALHDSPDAALLRVAIRNESARRAIPPFDSLQVSDNIRQGYPILAATVPSWRNTARGRQLSTSSTGSCVRHSLEELLRRSGTLHDWPGSRHDMVVIPFRLRT